MQFATFIQVAVLLFGVSFAFQVKSFADFLDFNHLKHGIIIMCNDGTFPREQLREISKTNNWLSFFNVDQARLEESRVEFGKLFYYGAPKVGVSLDLTCHSEVDNILEYASSGNFFNSSQAWLVLANSTETGMKAFDSFEINIDADITLGVKVEGENSLRLYDLYKVCHQCGTPLQSELKGNWSASEGMQTIPHFWQSTVQRRRNFSDITINGGIVVVDAPKDTPILNHIKGFNNKHLDSMQRKTYHILSNLEDIYNFRINLVISDSWGIEEHGNWTGVIGDMLAGKVAISLSPLRFTQQRILATHYLPVVHAEIIRFLFRHPQRSSIRNRFLQPFTSTVWYTVFAIITIGVLLLAITMRQESKRFIGLVCSKNNFDFFTLIILESIFLQGPSQMFHCVSTRMLIISICIFAVMLYQFYSAYIVGSLLADVRRTIVNMPALFNSSLDVGMEDIAYNYEFFINTSNQMAKDIYVHRIMKNPRTNILPLEKGLERIGRGGYAYHVAVVRAYRTLKDRLTQSEFCDLQEVAMETPFLSCPAVPHGSPYKEHFATAILKLREIGLMSYHDKLWSVEKPQCSEDMLGKDTTVDMGHFLPAMGFLAVAMLISCVVFGVELLKRHWLDALKRRRP